MKRFKAIYYPDSECSPLTLAKSILVFDELVFYDHASINFKNIGTVGHESHMRHRLPLIIEEGYDAKVVEPAGGLIPDEIKKLINADLSNDNYRHTFFKLMQNDPSFLMSKVGDGNYGIYGDGKEYRKKILSLKDSEVPRTAEEIEEFKLTRSGGVPPELNVALTMALDSYNLNFSAYMSMSEDLQLLGDSRGMDMMLKTKFQDKSFETQVDKGISEAVAYTMLEHTIPNEAFIGKNIRDIVRFRNRTSAERDKFKERVLEITVALQDLTGTQKRKKIDELVYKTLLPELRKFQEKQAKNWDAFFVESTKSVLYNVEDISKQIALTLPLSLATGLLTAATSVGVSVMPHLIDYLNAKKETQRTNPYAYLLGFK